jgi:hypothetical protein
MGQRRSAQRVMRSPLRAPPKLRLTSTARSIFVCSIGYIGYFPGSSMLLPSFG